MHLCRHACGKMAFIVCLSGEHGVRARSQALTHPEQCHTILIGQSDSRPDRPCHPPYLNNSPPRQNPHPNHLPPLLNRQRRNRQNLPLPLSICFCPPFHKPSSYGFAITPDSKFIMTLSLLFCFCPSFEVFSIRDVDSVVDFFVCLGGRGAFGDYFVGGEVVYVCCCEGYIASL